jgi:hypothetical protein
MERKFYDIHYHLFDLSHPNLMAFVLRDDLIDGQTIRNALKRFPLFLRFLPLWTLEICPGRTAERIRGIIQKNSGNIRNLLSVIEGAIEYHFLYTEYFLLREKKHFGSFPGATYNKIAISPLLMDFGYKNLSNPDCFYNLPAAKPVINQVVDLINAIWFYYNYDLIVHPDKGGRLKVIPTVKSKEEKLFEIYPFLGINTANYDLEEIVRLFDKYFRGYEDDMAPGSRQKKIYDKLGTIKTDVEDMISGKKQKDNREYYSHLFAGIKLYPPLGFDPWPCDARELEKVKFLYSECVRKRIPVTVHCSGKGFRTSPRADEFTDPSNRWREVLTHPDFRELKINFAHLGTQYDGKDTWLNAIIEYMNSNRSVYTDCSCQTMKRDDYERVRELVDNQPDNVLFGADYVINLIWSGSYNEYLNNFISTDQLTSQQKVLMCETNPEKFLFC